jgi:hypothetical protein
MREAGRDIAAGYLQFQRSDMSGRNCDDDDDEKDEDDAARRVTPGPAIGPGRNRTKQKQNEKNEENGPEHARYSLNGEAAPQSG